MAIADWFIVKSDAAMDVSLETTSPIDSTSSLRISQEDIATTTPVVNAHLRLVAGSPQSQFLKGKVRTLIEPKQLTDDDTSVTFQGIIGMMSQSNVFSAGGKAYFAGRWGASSPDWRIARVDNGVIDTDSFTVLASGIDSNIPDVDDIRAIEFEWVYDASEFNGVRLTFSAAPDSDFGNLVKVYQIVDTIPDSLDSTVGEGLFFSALHSTTGPVVKTLYDKTTIFELVPI